MGDNDQYEINDAVLEETASSARSLESRVETEGSVAAWDALAAALDDYERTTGGSADELLPADTASLAFAGSERAREFVIKALCNRRDELRGPIEAGINGGMVALVPALFAALALPIVAAPVIAIIAGVLMARGLDGLCRDAP
jgi:hypothetical protein